MYHLTDSATLLSFSPLHTPVTSPAPDVVSGLRQVFVCDDCKQPTSGLTPGMYTNIAIKKMGAMRELLTWSLNNLDDILGQMVSSRTLNGGACPNCVGVSAENM